MICPDCHGEGITPEWNFPETCPECGGSGLVDLIPEADLHPQDRDVAETDASLLPCQYCTCWHHITERGCSCWEASSRSYIRSCLVS